jgi:hypothetical protein
MNQEDAYRAYDCVRKEFPDYANFEGCPWIKTSLVSRSDQRIVNDEGWARSNRGYLLVVTSTKVKVIGPAFEGEWSVMQVKDFYLDPEMTVSLSEAPIG